MNVIGSGCAKRHAMAGASMLSARMRGAGLLGMILFALSVSDAHAADARKGETLAKRWCAACHVVAKDQPRGSEPAPPFASIASRDNFDAAKVALFLLAPHPLMPDMNLTRDEAANLAAYIAAQR